VTTVRSFLICLVQGANLIKEIFRESTILKKLDHKNIIQLHKAFIMKEDIVLIMDLASGGELKKYVMNNGQLRER
jgi:serine/threonine protein kinase